MRIFDQLIGVEGRPLGNSEMPETTGAYAMTPESFPETEISFLFRQASFNFMIRFVILLEISLILLHRFL